MESFTLLVCYAALLLLSGLFSSSETALFSLSRAQTQRLRERGTKTGRTVYELLLRPRRLLITVLVGNTLVNVAASSVLATFLTKVLGSAGVGVAIGLGTFLLLVWSSMTTKNAPIQVASRSPCGTRWAWTSLRKRTQRADQRQPVR